MKVRVDDLKDIELKRFLLRITQCLAPRAVDILKVAVLVYTLDQVAGIVQERLKLVPGIFQLRIYLNILKVL
jgi:hypothetical protein